MKIFTHKSCLPSAKILRSCMQEFTGNKIPVTTNPNKILGKQEFIRYGNSAETEGGNDLGLNQKELISMLSNKKVFSEILLKNGFYAPEFYYKKPDLRKNIFPIIIRETLSSFKGKGIHVVEDKDIFREIWRSGLCWTPFVPMRYELRVHIFNGKILKVFRKSWHSDEKEDKYPIRTNEGYSYILQDTQGNRYKKLESLVRSIHNKILKEDYRYYYLSLDVGWDKKNKSYFILEGNSGPGLNILTAKKYSEKIIETIGKK